MQNYIMSLRTTTLLLLSPASSSPILAQNAPNHHSRRKAWMAATGDVSVCPHEPVAGDHALSLVDIVVHLEGILHELIASTVV